MRVKSSTGGLNVGGSSILVIFVLLCLTTFATLAMVSANADYRLTQRAVEASTNYYAADSRAEEILAEINMMLMLSSQTHPTEHETRSWLQRVEHDDLFFYPAPTGGTITYSVPIDDTQAIEVALELQHAAHPRLRVVQWKVVVTAPLASFDEESFTLYMPF